MPSPPANKITIWLWPTGLFPRRLIYYLRAKRITLSALTAHNIHLIPVILDTATPKLDAKEGYEKKPEGMSLPCMRVEHVGEERIEYVHESLAIVGFLEEVFGGTGGEDAQAQGCGNIMGSTPSQRARTNDILSLLAEATVYANIALIHSDPTTLFWSGLTSSAMSASTAADASRRFHNMLSKLEGWVEKDVIKGQMSSLSGEGSAVTLADVVLMSSVTYAEDHNGVGWVEGHEGLTSWCERVKGCAWWVGAEGLRGCEESGWGAVLAE